MLRKSGIAPVRINSAINFIISWLCRCGQRYKISIDLNFNRRWEKTKEEYFREVDLSLSFTVFENCLKTNQKVSIQMYPDILDIQKYASYLADQMFLTTSCLKSAI